MSATQTESPAIAASRRTAPVPVLLTVRELDQGGVERDVANRDAPRSGKVRAACGGVLRPRTAIRGVEIRRYPDLASSRTQSDVPRGDSLGTQA